MKKLMCTLAAGLMLMVGGVSSARSQTQIAEGYTIVKTVTGPAVCMGRWVPSKDVALPGVCEGEMADLSYFNAVSSRLTADKLDQVLLALSALDQKLAVNNDQIRQLIEISARTQTSLDEQVRQGSDLLNEAIARRFRELPEKILQDEAFRKEIEKLKADILREVGTGIKQNGRSR